MKQMGWVKLKPHKLFSPHNPEKGAAAMLCWGWSSWESYAGPRFVPGWDHLNSRANTHSCSGALSCADHRIRQAGKDL